MRGRSISDNILVASEAHHTVVEARARPSMIIKMDMEKAFDKISRRFLLQALRSLGFPKMWTDWVAALTSSSSFAILINGSLSRWIPSSAGIRQGCPLSPYLFIVCSEIISRMLHDGAQNCCLTGLKLGRAINPVTHLFFADDIIVMAEATLVNARALVDIFQSYCSLSGQSSNKAKSVLVVSKRAPDVLKKDIQELMEIERADELGTYLGIPICAGVPKMKRPVVFQNREEAQRMESKEPLSRRAPPPAH